MTASFDLGLTLKEEVVIQDMFVIFLYQIYYLEISIKSIQNVHLQLCVLQFIEMQDQNRLLESQTLSLQQRLNNLLVCI